MLLLGKNNVLVTLTQKLCADLNSPFWRRKNPAVTVSKSPEAAHTRGRTDGGPGLQGTALEVVLQGPPGLRLWGTSRTGSSVGGTGPEHTAVQATPPVPPSDSSWHPAQCEGTRVWAGTPLATQDGV